MTIKKINLRSVLTFTLLMTSALLSGYGVYLENIGEPVKAYILVGVFLMIGFVVSGAFVYLEDEISKDVQKTKPLFYLMIVMSLVWLMISPIFNSITFTAKKAVEKEIGYNIKYLENIIDPYINRYILYKEQIVPKLVDIQSFLQHEIQKQDGMGGCGTICRELKRIKSSVDTPIQSLKDEYAVQSKVKEKNSREQFAVSSTSDEDTSIIAQINKEFSKLKKLSNSNDEIPTLINIHNTTISKIKQKFFELKSSRSPDRLSKTILQELQQLQEFLELRLKEAYSSNSSNKELIVASTQLTLNSLNNKLLDYEDAIEQAAGHSAKIINIKDRLQIENIELNVTLVFKHAQYYWHYIVAAFFVDLLALVLILAMTYLSNKEPMRNYKINSFLSNWKKLEKEEIDLRDEVANKLLPSNSDYDVTIKRYQVEIEKIKDDFQSKLESIEVNATQKEDKYSGEILHLEDELKNKISDIEHAAQNISNDNTTPLVQISQKKDQEIGYITNEYKNKIEIIKQKIQTLESSLLSQKNDLEIEANNRKSLIENKLEMTKNEKKSHILRLTDRIKTIDSLQEEIKANLEKIGYTGLIDTTPRGTEWEKYL